MNSSFWQRRKVFVTGATGLVGTWLVRSLQTQGAHVVALVCEGSARSAGALLQGCTMVQGSLADTTFLQRKLEDHQPQIVFHLAGQSQVRQAHQAPVVTLENNVQGTWNVLEACRKTTFAKVVLASSGQVYGVADSLPHRETSPLQASQPYKVSKHCAELIARM